MSFVSLGDNASTRPTFFEISAADSLMPSLKAATIYSLSVSCRSVLLLSASGIAAYVLNGGLNKS